MWYGVEWDFLGGNSLDDLEDGHCAREGNNIYFILIRIIWFACTHGTSRSCPRPPCCYLDLPLPLRRRRRQRRRAGRRGRSRSWDFASCFSQTTVGGNRSTDCESVEVMRNLFCGDVTRPLSPGGLRIPPSRARVRYSDGRRLFAHGRGPAFSRKRESKWKKGGGYTSTTNQHYTDRLQNFGEVNMAHYPYRLRKWHYSHRLHTITLHIDYRIYSWLSRG